MAAKGAVTKQKIIAKILEIFPNGFLYDGKEIRINDIEDGAPIQIKLTFTAAKTPVAGPQSPSQLGTNSNVLDVAATAEKSFEEPSEEEKARLTQFLQELGVQGNSFKQDYYSTYF